MSLRSIVSGHIHRIFVAQIAYAHCDIPCGIYDPHLAQIAALTTVRMNQLINDLGGDIASAQDRAKLARYIAVKEEHAELCKNELRILWGDYFKPEHLEQNPQIHELFWTGMKQASKVRQAVNLEEAQALLSKVHQIAEAFWATKGVATCLQPSNQTGGGELIYPCK